MSTKRFRKRTVDYSKPIGIAIGNDDDYALIKRENTVTNYFRQTKKEIIIPTIKTVPRVHHDVLPPQSTYIQYNGPTQKEFMKQILYDMDLEDKAFFNKTIRLQFAKLNMSHLYFELVVDRLEKCTGWFLNGKRYATVNDLLKNGLARTKKKNETIHCHIGESITTPSDLQNGHAEVHTLPLNKLNIKRYTNIEFHPSTLNDHISRTLIIDKRNRDAIEAIQKYWKAKRQRRIHATYYPTTGAPLLRQFDIPPDMNDENYKVPFRPREKPPSQPFGNHIYTHERVHHIIQNLNDTDKLLQKLEHRLHQRMDYVDVMRQILGYELRYVQQYGVRAPSSEDPQPPTKKRRLHKQHQQLELDHFLEGCHHHQIPIFHWAMRLHKTKSLPNEPKGPLSDTYFPTTDRLGRILLTPAKRLSPNSLINDPDMRSLHLTSRITHETDFVDDFWMAENAPEKFVDESHLGFEDPS